MMQSPQSSVDRQIGPGSSRQHSGGFQQPVTTSGSRSTTPRAGDSGTPPPGFVKQSAAVAPELARSHPSHAPTDVYDDNMNPGDGTPLFPSPTPSQYDQKLATFMGGAEVHMDKGGVYVDEQVSIVLTICASENSGVFTIVAMVGLL